MKETLSQPPADQELDPMNPGESIFPGSENYYDASKEDAESKKSEQLRQQEFEQWVKDKEAKENLEILENTEKEILWSLNFISDFKHKTSPILDAYIVTAEGITKENINDSLDCQNELISVLVEVKSLKTKIEEQKKDSSGYTRNFALGHIFDQLDGVEFSLSKAPDARYSETKDLKSWETTKSRIRRLQDSVEITESTLESLNFVFKNNAERWVIRRTAPKF